MRRWGTTVAAALIAVSASGCWLQVGGNALRTGDNAGESTVTAANVATLHQVWATTVSSHTAGAPVINGGRVFVASSPLMTAFSTTTGAQLWQKDTTQGPYPVPGLSDPAIVGGRVISEYSINVFGGTYSFDQTTGAYTDTGASQTFPYNAPAVSGNTVAVELGDVTSGGALTTISYGARTGFINFTSSLSDALPASNPMIAGNFVYATQGTTAFAFALDSCPSSPIAGDCGPTWTTDVGARAGMPVALSPTQIAVPLANGNVAVLDPTTGALQWTAVTGSTNAQSPAVTSTTMYVGTQDGNVRAFPVAGCGGATCSASWSGAAGAAIAAQPMVAGNVVYVGTADGRVEAFPASCVAATCSASFTATVDATATSVIPVVDGGTLFVTTDTGKVAAYRLP